MFKIVFLLILIIIIIFIIYQKFNNNNVIFLTDFEYIKNNLQPYINNINTIQIKYKTNFHLNKFTSKEDLLLFYCNSMLLFNKSEKKKIINSVKIIQKYIKDTSLLNKYKWKFIKYNGIEYEMPFTYGDVIFLSQKFIDDLDDNLDYFREVLLHEKIHICQRNNQNLFDFFYKKMNILINKNIIISEY